MCAMTYRTRHFDVIIETIDLLTITIEPAPPRANAEVHVHACGQDQEEVTSSRSALDSTADAGRLPDTDTQLNHECSEGD